MLLLQHQESTVSQISGFTVVDQASKKGSRGSRQHHDSITQVTHSNFDISHTLTKNDYFSDINPKSMRRLMNIVAVTGMYVYCKLDRISETFIFNFMCEIKTCTNEGESFMTPMNGYKHIGANY